MMYLWWRSMLSHEQIAFSLKKRRKALGMSQGDLSLRTGLTQQQISKLERGKDMYLSTLLTVMRTLNMEMLILPLEETDLHERNDQDFVMAKLLALSDD
jgi:predicted transcriptional regulator